MTTALFAGSFDPFTNGHLDVLNRGLDLFEQVVVAIGVHHGKKGMFSFEERADLIQASLEDKVRITSFDGLVVDAMRAAGAIALLRGLRDGTDLDYEMQMAGMNETMAPEVRTVFVPASPGVRHVTATLVRQISAMGGDVKPFVPAPVWKALNARQRAARA